MVSDDKKYNKKIVKELGLPLFSFKQTQDDALQNIAIWYFFNWNLGEAIEAQNGNHLYYGS